MFVKLVCSVCILTRSLVQEGLFREPWWYDSQSSREAHELGFVLRSGPDHGVWTMLAQDVFASVIFGCCIAPVIGFYVQPVPDERLLNKHC